MANKVRESGESPRWCGEAFNAKNAYHTISKHKWSSCLPMRQWFDCSYLPGVINSIFLGKSTNLASTTKFHEKHLSWYFLLERCLGSANRYADAWVQFNSKKKQESRALFSEKCYINLISGRFKTSHTISECIFICSIIFRFGSLPLSNCYVNFRWSISTVF